MFESQANYTEARAPSKRPTYTSQFVRYFRLLMTYRPRSLQHSHTEMNKIRRARHFTYTKHSHSRIYSMSDSHFTPELETKPNIGQNGVWCCSNIHDPVILSTQDY